MNTSKLGIFLAAAIALSVTNANGLPVHYRIYDGGKILRNLDTLNALDNQQIKADPPAPGHKPTIKCWIDVNGKLKHLKRTQDNCYVNVIGENVEW